MKLVFGFLIIILITASAQGQVPEKMSYQAVLRNGKNELIANRQIGLRISIIHGSVNGMSVYQEVFKPNPVTNTNGLVTAIIGSGTPILGTFSSINWASGPYFIQAETDTTGGSNYTIAGTTQLLSVPYALHAKTAESVSGKIPETDPLFAAWNKNYNDITNKPDLSVYATKEMLNQGNSTSVDYNKIINKPDLSVYATKDMINQNNSGNDYNSIINKPDLTVFATKEMLNLNFANPDYNYISNKPDLSIYATKDMANQNITNLANPVNPQDAATKAYADSILIILEKLETDKILEDGFIDERDGNHYEVVQIGSQIWMAENLKYLPVAPVAKNPMYWSNTQPIYYVYGFDSFSNLGSKASTNYNVYGVLYNWPAALNGNPESNSSSGRVQGVCPSGWHLPNHDEWDQLIDFMGGDKVAGGNMKETGTWHWNSPNTGATDKYGFNALPAGTVMQFNDNFEFAGLGFNAKWWIAPGDNTNAARHYHSLSYTNSSIKSNYWGYVDEKNFKAHGFSVRCVKD